MNLRAIFACTSLLLACATAHRDPVEPVSVAAAPTPTAQAPEAPPAVAPEPDPACMPVKSEDADGNIHLRIGSIPIGLPADAFDPEVDELAVYRFDEATILVAVRNHLYQQVYPEMDRETVLWQVHCGDPSQVSELDRDPLADYGHGARVGDHLIHTHDGVVSAMDLRTKSRRPLTTQTTYDSSASCWSAGEEHGFSTDVVLGRLPNGGIELERGAPCGFEADWESELWVMLDPLGKPRLYRESPISTVMVDADGVVWVGNAGNVEVEQQLQTYGAVWRSPDAGDTWQRVDVPGMECAAKAVYADATRAGQVLVVEDDCSTGPADACDEGCGAFITRDGGVRWKNVAEQLPLEDPHIDDVWPEASNLDVLWATWDEEAFVSRNGGRSWDRAEAPQASGSRDAPRTARHAGITYTGTRDGLLRERDNTRSIVFRTADQR